jgi:ribosomal protein S10
MTTGSSPLSSEFELPFQTPEESLTQLAGIELQDISSLTVERLMGASTEETSHLIDIAEQRNNTTLVAFIGGMSVEKVWFASGERAKDVRDPICLPSEKEEATLLARKAIPKLNEATVNSKTFKRVIDARELTSISFGRLDAHQLSRLALARPEEMRRVIVEANSVRNNALVGFLAGVAVTRAWYARKEHLRREQFPESEPVSEYDWRRVARVAGEALPRLRE